MARILVVVAALLAVAAVPGGATGRTASCDLKANWEPTNGITATSATLHFTVKTTCSGSVWVVWTTVVNGTTFTSGTDHAGVPAMSFAGFTATMDALFPGATYDVIVHLDFPGSVQQLTQQVTTLSRLRVFRSVGGAVTSPAGEISCGAACVQEAPAGTAATLTAAPLDGYRFSRWEGACTGTDPTCAVTIAGDVQASAFFTPARTLFVSVGGSGSGSVGSSPAGISCGATCAALFDAGASVTLTAKPADGSVFAGWTGGGCGARPTCTVTLSNDVAVGARFTKLDTLLVQKRGKGAGSVASDVGGISCGTSCSAKLERGTQVTLLARPGRRSRFAGWGGSCSGRAVRCVVTLSGDSTVTATFARKPRPKKRR